MAYTNENNAGFLCTALKFGAVSHGGPIGSTHQRIAVKEPVNAGGNVTPVGRPLKMLDARVLFRCLDMSSVDAVSATPANCETDIQECDGSTTGSIIHGPMTPGNADDNTDHANGPHNAELEYLFKGSALTETISQ